jgi:hypothetical protein
MTTDTIGGAYARVLMAGFKGAAKRIEDVDLPRIAYEIGCGEDELHAIIDVEAPKSGFDALGRPRILFEPHVFYRNLPEGLRRGAVAAKLACQSWGQLPYGKESEQYPKLMQALKIHETAALKACSWGRAQILGENHLAAGYASPQEMVVDFTLDEDNHLEAMVRFIKANGLDDELRQHNWAAFARGYNGPQYAKNGYHTKLKAAYEKWSRIKDTPWAPEADPTVAVIPPPPDIEPPPVPMPQPAASGGFFFAALKQVLEALFGRKA